jgi:hypothetical protein
MSGPSHQKCKWKDPELKGRRLKKSDRRCVRSQAQTFSSKASLLLYDLSVGGDGISHQRQKLNSSSAI